MSNFSLDRIYRGVFGNAGMAFTRGLRWIDDRVVDGFVNGVGSLVSLASDALRLTQTSFVRNYALAMALGAAVVIAFFLQVVLKS
jgi:NADH-quinone oxidoreductase subunit L